VHLNGKGKRLNNRYLVCFGVMFNIREIIGALKNGQSVNQRVRLIDWSCENCFMSFLMSD